LKATEEERLFNKAKNAFGFLGTAWKDQKTKKKQNKKKRSKYQISFSLNQAE